MARGAFGETPGSVKVPPAHQRDDARSDAPKKSKGREFATIVCVLALLVGGAYYYYKYHYLPDQRRQEQAAEQARVEAAQSEEARQREERVSKLLSGAAEDLASDRLTSPAGANAWEKYQSVLELEPGHEAATAGLDSIISRYVVMFEGALGRKEFDTADEYVSRIRGVWVDAPVLSSLDGHLSAARGAEQRRQREEQRARLAEEEAERLRQSKLAEYKGRFEESLGRKEFDKAGRYVDSIKAVDADAPVLSGLEGRLSAAREAERLRQEQQRVGRTFRDCAQCPQMVVVPSGSFTMGSPNSEKGRYHDEGPRHRVSIDYRFAVGVYEVTFAEWDACVSAGGCGGYRPDDAGWDRGNRPVINVSWEDAQSYVRWLSQRTGESYRLLSESEWEYVARAGSVTAYSWGNDIGHNRANCAGCGSRWDNQKTAPVGAFGANAWGLYDVHGNVWEWVENCWHYSYTGAPADGSAWESGDCSVRVLRGGSWNNKPSFLRSAIRGRDPTGKRYIFNGFRVARTLTP